MPDVVKSKRPRYESEIRRDKVRNKTRICIGDAFEKWRRLKTESNWKTDAKVAHFLLDSHVESGEVIVKLQCLLQLFYKCSECHSECTIGTKRDGRFLNVRQKCQQCLAVRVWRSHPADHVISSPAANQEVAKEMVLLSCEETDTDEEVKGHDSLSQLGKGSKEGENIGGLHPLSWLSLADGPVANGSKDSGQMNTHKEEIVSLSCGESEIPTSIKEEEEEEEEEQEVNRLTPWSQRAEAELLLANPSVDSQGSDLVVHTPDTSGNRSSSQEDDGRKDGCSLTDSEGAAVVKVEDEEDDGENVNQEQEEETDETEEGKDNSDDNEEEEMEVEDSDDESHGEDDGAADEDWDPASAGLKKLSASENDSSSDPKADAEALLPLVWCCVCGSEFKHDCFKQRHSRLYGCIRCGTTEHKHTHEDGGTSNNQRTCSDQETRNCNNQNISDGGREKNICDSDQHSTSACDGNQDGTSICELGVFTGDSNQEASSCNREGESNDISKNGSQEEASCRNTGKEQDEEHVQSLHVEKLAVLFKSLHDFETHLIQCHGISQFRSLCTDCGKFITMRNIIDGGPPHICEHKAKPIICPTCGKRFATEVGLQAHSSRIHDEKYKLTCRYCLKAFRSPEDKEEHEEGHLEELLRYYCPGCPERFPDRPSWCAHMKSHWPNGRHVCDVCNKSFPIAVKLIRHMAIHTGLKPYSCELCHRSFNQAGHLKSHMRLHTGEKPFKCQDCGQCFNHNVSLKNHVQRYHGPGAEKKKGKRR